VKLHLIRHGLAGHADPARWPDDALRPLTKDGVRRFRRAAAGLSQLVPDVDVLLSSGLARAWQTAELLHDVAGWPAPLECPALEAGRPASSGLDLLRERDEQSIALVGHEPYLSSLASLLCTGSEGGLHLEFKKGAVVSLDVEDSVAPGSTCLRWSVSPRILRRVAEDGLRPAKQ
jgi:phosphohistidine phosphatase